MEIRLVREQENGENYITLSCLRVIVVVVERNSETHGRKQSMYVKYWLEKWNGEVIEFFTTTTMKIVAFDVKPSILVDGYGRFG